MAARRVLARGDAVARATGACAADEITRRAAISACEKGRRWEQALRLLHEMWRSQLEPDVVSCNAAISACEKCRQLEQALNLLQEMERARLEPDVVSYNAAISACEKGKR